jgi:hypothetical protein
MTISDVGRFVTALVVVALASQPANGQARSKRPSSNPDSVRLAADLFFRAVADERWEVAAALVDTVAIRRRVAEQVRNPPERARRELTVEDFIRMDSTKPRVVAEYEAKRYREQVAKFDAGQMLGHEFFGVRSIQELRALSTLEASARYIQAQDFRMLIREQVLEQARKAGCSMSASAALAPISLHRIIAVALANDTLAYVLHDDGMFGTHVDRGPPTDPMLMQLRLHAQGWRVYPTPGMLGRSGIGFGPMQCDSVSGRPRR